MIWNFLWWFSKVGDKQMMILANCLELSGCPMCNRVWSHSRQNYWTGPTANSRSFSKDLCAPWEFSTHKYAENNGNPWVSGGTWSFQIVDFVGIYIYTHVIHIYIYTHVIYIYISIHVIYIYMIRYDIYIYIQYIYIHMIYIYMLYIHMLYIYMIQYIYMIIYVNLREDKCLSTLMRGPDQKSAIIQRRTSARYAILLWLPKYVWFMVI